jgi:hypothetical protein
MKNRILLFFVVFLACQKLFAQTDFAPINSVWHSESIPDMDIEGMNYYKYESQKDTIYFGQNCKKIVGKTVRYSPSKYTTVSLRPEYFYTSGDTVFYYNHHYDRFFPIYNFNVKKGDSLVLHIPYPWPSITDSTFTTYIDSVIWINISGQTLRKVYTSSPKSTKLSFFYLDDYIERIGSLKTIGMNGFSFFDGFGNSGGLRCYSDDSLSLTFKAGGTSICEYLLPLSLNNEKSITKFSISPNPASGAINIFLPNNSKIDQLCILNMQGQQLQSWSKAPISNSIDVADLPNGVYFVSVTIDGITSHQKIIIHQ